MIQTEQATEFAKRVHDQAVKRAGKVAKPVDTAVLIDIVRPMVARYNRDDYRGSIEVWTKLARLFR